MQGQEHRKVRKTDKPLFIRLGCFSSLYIHLSKKKLVTFEPLWSVDSDL